MFSSIALNVNFMQCLVKILRQNSYISKARQKQKVPFGISEYLTLKAPIKTAANKSYIFFHRFSEKIRLDISCESSAEHQALFSPNNKSKKNK